MTGIGLKIRGCDKNSEFLPDDNESDQKTTYKPLVTIL